MAVHKVIFDTDPGVDDAMALLFLHLSPDVDLVGITTTFGNGTIEQTTFNALYLAERFGMTASVAQGAAKPLVGDPRDPPTFIHGGNALGGIDLPERLDRKVDPRPAHRFIIDTLRASPGEVSIVAVGRMTNLALALREAPDIVDLVRDVTVMGGAFGFTGVLGNATPAAEANIFGDPEAADEICAAAWPLTFVGLDVTQQTLMSTDYLAELANRGGEAGRFIWDISRFYEAFHHTRGNAAIFVHDASAVTCLLRPGLFTRRSGVIRVSTEGVTRGMTVQKPDGRPFAPGPWDGRPSHQVCVTVDSDGLRSLYRDTILGLA